MGLSIGRRISLAFAGGVSLGLMFYWLGELLVTAVPTAPASSPIVGLTVGAATAVTIALSADLTEAVKNSKAE